MGSEKNYNKKIKVILKWIVRSSNFNNENFRFNTWDQNSLWMADESFMKWSQKTGVGLKKYISIFNTLKKGKNNVSKKIVYDKKLRSF